MNLFLSVLYGLFFVIVLLLSMLLFIPYGCLRLMQFQRGADAYMNVLSRAYSYLLFGCAGIRVTVKGKERLPKKDTALVFVSNHQSITDIPALRIAVPYQFGFMVKLELFRAPFIQVWLAGMRCIAIDRGNLRRSMESIRKGSEQVSSGYPMLIFPEGTRSRSNGMRSFKGGSLKLAEWANARVVPMTVDGTYRIVSPKGIAFRSQVTVTFHEPIDTSQLSREEIKALPQRLWAIVNSGLKEPNETVMPPKAPKDCAKKKKGKESPAASAE